MKDGKVIRRFNPPQKQPKPVMIPFQIMLKFVSDGKVILTAPFQGEMPTPPADQAVNLELNLDAQKLLTALEAQLGPKKQSVQLWKPGQ